jgi:hypothetical protein
MVYLKSNIGIGENSEKQENYKMYFCIGVASVLTNTNITFHGF